MEDEGFQAQKRGQWLSKDGVTNEAPKLGSNPKIGKAVATEVTMLDMILERETLKREIGSLKKKQRESDVAYQLLVDEREQLIQYLQGVYPTRCRPLLIGPVQLAKWVVEQKQNE